MPAAQVSVSMQMEMLETLDELATKHNITRAETVRHLIRQAEDSPFEPPKFNLENNDEAQTGAA